VFQLSSREFNTHPHPVNVELYRNVKDYNGVRPLCTVGNKGLYIDAQGRLFPCCWVANRYSHNQEWTQRADQFNLNNRRLTEVLTDDFWTTEFKEFAWLECKTKCASNQVDEKYATEW
jgi:hypothetical protein